MNFWKKIFNTDKPQNLPSEIEDPNITVDKNGNELQNSKVMALIDSVKSTGHPEYPLLRREYATSSRMPCRDFSSWISQQLKDKDYNALWAFVKTFYQEEDNSGVGIELDGLFDDILIKPISEKYGISHSDAKKEVEKSNLDAPNTKNNELSLLRKAFDKFLKKDFGEYITADENTIFELQSFFIVKGIDDFNREFWIAEGGQAESLAKMLSVYSFETNKQNFDRLISKANLFLKEMKGDKQTDYWKPYPYYKIGELDLSYSIPTHTTLLEKLQSLSIGERLYFFDYATTYSYRKYWNGDSTYKTRSFGIDEPIALQKIIALNIFDLVDDIDSIPEITSKSELKEKAEQGGFEIKKSWTLDKIFVNLKSTEKGSEFLRDFIIGKKILRLKPEYKTDLAAILDFQKTIKKVADLLCMI